MNNLQAILSWYHNHNSKVLKANNGELEQMLLNITGEEPKLPRTKRMTQYYSKKYYDTQIKSAFDGAMAIEMAKPAEDQKSHIAVRTQVTEEAWSAEPEVFKTWLMEQRDTAQKKLAEEFKQKVEEDKRDLDSPESYHVYVCFNVCYTQGILFLTLQRIEQCSRLALALRRPRV